MGMQFQQNLGEPLAVWLLQLWETRVYSIMCFRNEEMAGIYNRSPLIETRLQDVRQLMQSVPKQTHALMEQINSAIHTMMTSVLLAAF